MLTVDKTHITRRKPFERDIGFTDVVKANYDKAFHTDNSIHYLALKSAPWLMSYNSFIDGGGSPFDVKGFLDFAKDDKTTADRNKFLEEEYAKEGREKRENVNYVEEAYNGNLATSLLGVLAGGAGALATDPINVLGGYGAYRAGAKFALGRLGTAKLEAGVGVGIEAASYPLVSKTRELAGEEYTKKELVLNMALAGTIGGAVGYLLPAGKAKAKALKDELDGDTSPGTMKVNDEHMKEDIHFDNHLNRESTEDIDDYISDIRSKQGRKRDAEIVGVFGGDDNFYKAPELNINNKRLNEVIDELIEDGAIEEADTFFKNDLLENDGDIDPDAFIISRDGFNYIVLKEQLPMDELKVKGHSYNKAKAYDNLVEGLVEGKGIQGDKGLDAKIATTPIEKVNPESRHLVETIRSDLAETTRTAKARPDVEVIEKPGAKTIRDANPRPDTIEAEYRTIEEGLVPIKPVEEDPTLAKGIEDLENATQKKLPEVSEAKAITLCIRK